MGRTRKSKPICYAVKDVDGVILKILPTAKAASRWAYHNCVRNHGLVIGSLTRFGAEAEFDRQMKLGLTDTDVINSLLWYGGVSTALGNKHFFR